MYLRWFSVKKEVIPTVTPTNSMTTNTSSAEHISLGLGIFGAIWLGAVVLIVFILMLFTRSCNPAYKKDYEYQELDTTDHDQKRIHNDDKSD